MTEYYRSSDRLYHNAVKHGKDALETLIDACRVEIGGFEQTIDAEKLDPIEETPKQSARYITWMEECIAILRRYEQAAQRGLDHWASAARESDDTDELAERTAALLRSDLAQFPELEEPLTKLAEALETGDYSRLAF